ncbi:hypothetical protein [Epilithonimonas hungarica]|uniref:Uncharacterized protein n=1 Tax=Epilithonimonas hungarica TaxID=454006 RepID=A0A1G7PG09_9FLAO|nr:hypothetical protein [Epilithonimonas hungarica]SDF85191.1 hypothetical protein SAMN05421825_2285 [Epilithonimonas hungarica]
MKFKYFLALFPIMFFSQKTTVIKFYDPIKDNTKTFRTLSVIDNREDKELGTITHKKETYRFEFPDNDAKKSIDDWFVSSNKTPSGANDMVVFLEDFRVFSEDVQNATLPKAEVKISSFVLKEGNYYYLDRINKVVNISPNVNKTPFGLSYTLSNLLHEFIKTSFKTKPSELKIGGDQLANYADIITSGLPAFKDTQIKDGVYPDYKSFFDNTPSEGYELVKNSKGEVVRAKKGDERIPAYKMFAYAENGKIYHHALSGFLELMKDDKGFYVFTNYVTLFPVEADSTYGMFGLIGGVAGAIDANAKNKKLQKEEKYNIYIDPLTGDYILRK